MITLLLILLIRERRKNKELTIEHDRFVKTSVDAITSKDVKYQKCIGQMNNVRRFVFENFDLTDDQREEFEKISKLLV